MFPELQHTQEYFCHLFCVIMICRGLILRTNVELHVPDK